MASEYLLVDCFCFIYLRKSVVCFLLNLLTPSFSVCMLLYSSHISTSYWTREEGESKTGHAYYMFSFALIYAWIVKQSLFSCAWFHSVGGESTTMIEDEGAGWFFFPRWAPHGRWLLAAISLSAGVSVNPTLARGILNARWRELSLKS